MLGASLDLPSLSQERLWKRTAACVFAHAAAAAARKGGLRTTKVGEQMRAEAAAALVQVQLFPNCLTFACMRLKPFRRLDTLLMLELVELRTLLLQFLVWKLYVCF